MKRREFLKSAAATGLASQVVLGAQEELPKRTYKDDIKLSVIGFGGIIMMGQEQPKANKIVAEAVGRGLHLTATVKRRRNSVLHFSLTARMSFWHVRQKNATAKVRVPNSKPR
jgi:hypothetical protein